ncbi:hypothetical protein [Streptomyces sp. NPDC013457]|uniref:hypothetical protein n=1 Tax=Streptomyces sp. NPDC013457 TaxID=3364866 RepID=UPI0036F7F36E
MSIAPATKDVTSQLEVTWTGELPSKEEIPDVQEQVLAAVRHLLEGPDGVTPEGETSAEVSTTKSVKVTITRKK